MKKISLTLLALTMVLISVIYPLSASAEVSSSAEGFTYEFDNNCESLFMVSLDNDTIVYSLNADEVRPMASLTKIMTYIVAYENIPDIENTIITIDASVETDLENTGSSLSGVMVGEELSALELLNLMMIPSGNDAALALAKYVDEVTGNPAMEGGTGSHFVDLMNQKAQELGCTNTHFMNPHGLHETEHYTTAREMAVITKYATKLPYFSDITSSTSYTLRATNMYNETRTVYATNKMLTQADDGMYNYVYATGIKTGSLNESGYCIAASALYEGYSYLVIALGSPYVDSEGNDTDYHGEMVDAATLFRWAFTQLSYKTVVAEGDLIGQVNVDYAWDKDRLQVVAAENIAALVPKDVSLSSLIPVLDLPDKVQAPIKKGDVIGSATFYYANQEVATVNLVAYESVERSEIVQTVEVTKEILTSPVFIIIFAILVVILIIYLIIIIMYNNKRKKMRRVKKYRDL